MNTSALVAYRALSDAAGKGAFFLVTLIAARRLSQHAFGVFSLGTTVGWMVAVATDFGIQLHLAREVSQRRGAPLQILRGWLRVRLWTAAAAIVLAAVGLAVVRPGGGIAAAVMLFTVVYVVNALVELLHYFYRGISRSDIESTLTLAQRGTMLLLACAVLWLRPGVTLLALAMLIPAVSTFAYSAARACAMAARASSQIPPAAAPRGIRIELARDVMPIGAGIVFSALYFRIDVLLIELWNGTAAVATYNAVFRLVEALRLFPAAVLAVMLPALCRATTRRPLFQVSAMVTATATAASAVLWWAAGWLVPLLYGDAYAAGVGAFRILLLSFPLMSLNYALTHQLIGWRGHWAYAGICAAALVFNVALNARLLPAMGIAGAAWATVLTEIVITIGALSSLGARRTGAVNPANLVNPMDPLNPAIPVNSVNPVNLVVQ